MVAVKDTAEHKRIEEVLLRCDGFTEGLINSMKDGFSLIDKRGVHLDVNKALCRMTGFTRQELIGTGPPHPYWPKEEHKNIAKAFQKTLKGRFEDFELTFKRKNGERFPVIVSPSQLKDKKGNVLCFFATVKDITERKKAEEKLQENERRYRLISENTSDFVAITDLDRKFVYASPSYRRLGYEPDKLIGTNSFKHLHPDDKKRFLPMLKQATSGVFKKGAGRRVEFRLRDKLGKYHYMESTTNLIRDGSGKLAILSVFRDVTERKKAEKALRESESKYATLVEKSNDGIIIIQDGVLKFINERMVGITGFTTEEELGKNFIDFVSPAFRKLVIKRYKKRMSGAKVPERYEIEILSKDGRNIPVEINASVIKYKGRPADMAIIRDVTGRKELEKQQFESNRRLQRVAQELTIARDELKVAIETKGEFMNIVAHELKTPLQPIIGYTDRLLHTRNPTEWQKARLTIILDNAEHLRKLVQDVLDINKMETGVMKFSMKRFDLLGVVRGVYKSFRPLAAAKGLKLTLNVPKTLSPIEGDPGRLNQVFSNLLDNAIKFTNKGSITIKVREGKKTITVSVKDTGIGIAERDAPNLFTKFFQVDASDKRRQGGTGLGLAICKEIVKVHKGRISVRSTLRKGSTFYIGLPKLTKPSKGTEVRK